MALRILTALERLLDPSADDTSIPISGRMPHPICQMGHRAFPFLAATLGTRPGRHSTFPLLRHRSRHGSGSSYRRVRIGFGSRGAPEPVWATISTEVSVGADGVTENRPSGPSDNPGPEPDNEHHR